MSEDKYKRTQETLLEEVRELKRTCRDMESEIDYLKKRNVAYTSLLSDTTRRFKSLLIGLGYAESEVGNIMKLPPEELHAIGESYFQSKSLEILKAHLLECSAKGVDRESSLH